VGHLYTTFQSGALSDEESEVRQREVWAGLQRFLEDAPHPVRRLYREMKGGMTIHDAWVRSARLDLRTRRLALVLRQDCWCPATRIAMTFRGIQLTDGDVALWRALLRRRRIEWLYEAWERVGSELIELRTLWFAGPRRKPTNAPYYETVVRFASVDVEVRRERRARRLSPRPPPPPRVSVRLR
jgi:hypothetical protein